MATIDQRFRCMLSDSLLQSLEAEPASIYGVWDNLSFSYLNPAWFRFARENHGEPAISTRWGLGSSLLDAIPDPLRAFYENHLLAVLAGGKAWEHEYECSSAEVFRKFHQKVYPVGEHAGLIVVNSLLVEHPHDPASRPPLPPDEHRYRMPDGFLCQCSHCRRMRRTGDPLHWDWVPYWITHQPEGISHGLCPVCLEYYYPEYDEGE